MLSIGSIGLGRGYQPLLGAYRQLLPAIYPAVDRRRAKSHESGIMAARALESRSRNNRFSSSEFPPHPIFVRWWKIRYLQSCNDWLHEVARSRRFDTWLESWSAGYGSANSFPYKKCSKGDIPSKHPDPNLDPDMNLYHPPTIEYVQIR